MASSREGGRGRHRGPAQTHEGLDDGLRSAITAAVTTAVAESQLTTAPVVGRTPWDAIAEVAGNILGLLGKSAVYLLCIGLIAVGWFFFEQQQSEKERFYTEQLQALEAERNKAFALVQDSYKEIAEVGGGQITNLDKSLNLLKNISDEVDSTQKKAFDQKVATLETQQELDQAREQIERAAEEIREKELSLLNAEKAAETVRRQKESEIEDALNQLKQEKVELEEKQAALALRAGTIAKLQDQLRLQNDAAAKGFQAISDEISEMITTIFPSAQAREESVNLGELLNLKIPLTTIEDRADYEAWARRQNNKNNKDIDIDPSKILRSFANLDWIADDTSVANLIGVSEADLLIAIEKGDGLGFDLWTRAVLSDPVEHETIVGFILDLNQKVMRTIRLVIDHDLSQEDITDADGASEGRDSKRIIEAFHTFSTGPAYVPDEDNWLEKKLIVTELKADGTVNAVRVGDSRSEADGVILPQKLLGAVALKPIVGKSEPIDFLTGKQFDSLANSFQDVSPAVSRTLLDPFETPRLNFDMLARSEEPEAIIITADLDYISDTDLRKAVNKLVRLAIDKDTDALGKLLGGGAYLDGSEVAGRLGAFALRPKFSVAEVSTPLRLAADTTLSEQQSGSSLSMDQQTSIERIEVKFTVEVNPNNDKDLLSLVFERNAPTSTWYLVDLSQHS